MKKVSKLRHLAGLRQVLRPYRYLFCVDLEATCDEAPTVSPSPRPPVVPKDEMETIALGVLVVDLRALKVVDEFQRFVRPIIHPRLTAFCKTVTGIRQPEVDQAPAYGVVAAELSEFLERYPSALWSSWGSYEAKQLTMDAARIGCAPLLGGLGHQDIKKWHAKIFGCRAMGLQPAVEALGLSWQGTYHRGIDDAQNLANLVLRVLKDEPYVHSHSDPPQQ